MVAAVAPLAAHTVGSAHVNAPGNGAALKGHATLSTSECLPTFDVRLCVNGQSLGCLRCVRTCGMCARKRASIAVTSHVCQEERR